MPSTIRAQRRLDDVAVRDAELLVRPGFPASELLDRPSFLRVGRAVVVGADGRPLGIVSATDIERRLGAAALLAPRQPSSR